MSQVNQQGNLWNAALTGAGGFSAKIQLPQIRLVTIFGHVDGACTLTVEWSADGTNFYDSGTTIVAAGAQDVGASLDCATNWIRVKSNNNVTATLTVAGS